MMNIAWRDTPHFLTAMGVHVLVLCALLYSFEHSAPLIVFENTAYHDAISAVVLGDTEKSKLLPQPIKAQPIEPKKSATPPPKTVEQAVTKKDVVPLKSHQVKKDVKSNKDDIAHALLNDIKKHKPHPQNKPAHKTVDENKRFEKALRDNAEKSLRQALLDEDVRLQSQITARSQGIVNQYAALIKEAVGQRWLIPANANKKLHCQLKIRLAPGGVVLDVQVMKSSGDIALDRSAKTAVFNASPLPVPKDPKIFDQFREFAMDATPQDVVRH